MLGTPGATFWSEGFNLIYEYLQILQWSWSSRSTAVLIHHGIVLFNIPLCRVNEEHSLLTLQHVAVVTHGPLSFNLSNPFSHSLLLLIYHMSVTPVTPIQRSSCGGVIEPSGLFPWDPRSRPRRSLKHRQFSPICTVCLHHDDGNQSCLKTVELRSLCLHLI